MSDTLSPSKKTQFLIDNISFFIKKGMACSICGDHSEKYQIYQKRDIRFSTQNSWLTKDHIIPKSLGGTDHDWNLRPACSKCNSIRGNKVSIEDINRLNNLVLKDAVAMKDNQQIGVFEELVLSNNKYYAKVGNDLFSLRKVTLIPSLCTF